MDRSNSAGEGSTVRVLHRMDRHSGGADHSRVLGKACLVPEPLRRQAGRCDGRRGPWERRRPDRL